MMLEKKKKNKKKKRKTQGREISQFQRSRAFYHSFLAVSLD